ncbi:MAG TPA: hypothetical protein VIY47_05780 [Ignavibacteriaceae bacterium]
MIKIKLKEEENMKGMLFFVLFLFLPIGLLAQAKTDQDIDLAYQNAKKGVYWALSNIPGKKATLDNDLIAEDKLYASVKISKEVQGVKVVSTGYYQTNQVGITIYKSYESLKAEGYNVPSSGWGED